MSRQKVGDCYFLDAKPGKKWRFGTSGSVCWAEVTSADGSKSGLRRAEQAAPLQIREDSYGTQNLSYDIGICYRGADESA
jgi:hypothetical protein